MVDVLYRMVVFAMFLIMYVAFLESHYGRDDDNYSNKEFLTDIFLLTAAFIIGAFFIMFGGGACV
jgi:hypothetical protein